MLRTALSLLNLTVFFWLLNLTATKADIIPDTTLPNNSTVREVGNLRVIEGGTQRGVNLFHSFQEFSFSALTSNYTGDTAIFNHNLGVQNIITRVTGSTSSYIDGLITATRGSRANLFFINPHGIILGPNASLNIGGSFVATTANSLKFADGTEFSATAANQVPLLTVSVPLGLQFGNNPGNIEQPISYDLPLVLQVENGKTLALIGGNILLESSILSAPGGRIELGSVAGNSFVSLSEIDKGYALGYLGVKDFRDIKISAGTLINTDNLPRQDSSGAIQIQARNIRIEDSLIFAVNFGVQSGDRLTINATESLKLSGGSSIFTIAQNTGQAGDIWIKAKNSLELGQEAFIASQVCSLSGNCQNVTGNGGNIHIETGRLLVTDGAGIEASTFGAGNAGNIFIKATDSINLIGESPDGNIPSGIFAEVARDATKNAGNTGTISLETQRLQIAGGAQILNIARYGTQGGNVNIKASESIYVSGASQFATTSPLDIFRSGIFVSTQAGTTNNTLNINTGKFTVADGARITTDNLNIISDRLIVQDGAKIAVTGESGNLVINARSLKLDNQGQLTTQTNSGNGGNITLNLNESLQLSRNSRISTFVGGNGGNIEINSPLIVATPNENSDITAYTFRGTGGKVTTNTASILGLVVRSRAELAQILNTTDPYQLDSASLASNDIITLSQTKPSLKATLPPSTPEVNSNRKFLPLPTRPLDTSEQITQTCSSNSSSKEKLETGNSPDNSDSQENPSSAQPSQHNHLLQSSNIYPHTVVENPDSPKIVEAQGWIIDHNGQIILVARIPTANYQYPWYSSTICHVHE
ncbi:two-partner secretion domain-containing protein [Anabaena azotica]|uniref:Filamentous hemagglutinin N-terminal domain-containing protein n=1 Tax=Anabaena azotica FACHB-119 TaxID=947527 RepID=A0ABR8D814_9NOST|nr:filamentous hemagglutinin N-terminal domain-containing protein [Anabaena azotica]MBD2503071.1 filamentous hemagglutinin N-terminal domain-containing protein [Anabaena azotica FACHB-119]